MKKWFDKHIGNVFVIIVAISVLGTLAYYLIDGTRNIDDQKTILFEKEKLVGTDFSKLWQVDNATLHFENNLLTVKYSAVDCTLSVTYDQNFEIVSKQLEDLRIGTNPISLVASLLCALVISVPMGFVLLLLIDLAIELQEWIAQKLVNRKAKKMEIQK